MYKQLSEILAAARLISRTSGATIKELENHLHLSRRSIYRLLDTLEELGYPLYDEFHGKERFIFLNEHRDNLRWWLPYPQVQLNSEDVMLLEYVFMEAAKTPAVANEIRRLKGKLQPLLAEGGYTLAGDLHQSGILPAPSLSKKFDASKNQLFKTILQGIQERTVCIVSYQAISSATIKTFRIHPLTLMEKNSGLYLFVFVPYYENMRILAVERIKNIELTEETFTVPENFNLEPWLKDPFGIILNKAFTARIWFSPEQAPYIQELTWPDGSKLEPMDDGSLILTVQTAANYELKRWVLSFGSSACLLEPDYLRREIQKELQDTEKLYQ
jgi:predicted DNA-binding transcriptional regulator YafY